MGWSKLDSGILDSSIWAEPYPTRLVWVAMLARKNSEGYVAASVSGVQRFANVTREETEAALLCLESPDPDSRSQVHEGKRIQKVDGGWVVLNHQQYREFSYSDSPEAIKKRKQRQSGTSGDMSPLCPQEEGRVPFVPGHSVSVSVSSSLNSSLNPKKEGEGGEVHKGKLEDRVCVRLGKKVACIVLGDYVHLTRPEYSGMVQEWGVKFTRSAIEQYDARIPNSPAARKHTDHNRAIRDYVNRGYICAGMRPERPVVTKTKEPDDLPPQTPAEAAEIRDMAQRTIKALAQKGPFQTTRQEQGKPCQKK
jgi:hypothetical protein